MPIKQAMTDKEYIEDILLTSKTLSVMYHSATQEASTEKLHCTFKNNLNGSLEMQHKIFCAMQQNGWYPMQQADQNQINQVKTKYLQQ